MMPFQAGQSTGFQSVVGSGIEARGRGRVLHSLTIAGIDESSQYIDDRGLYLGDFVETAPAARSARDRGFWVLSSLWDYPTTVGTTVPDRVTPEGVDVASFPGFTYIFGARNQETGVQTEGRDIWLARITGLVEGFRISPGVSTINFKLDNSGSMVLLDWASAAERTKPLLESQFPGVIVTIDYTRDERWLTWFSFP